MDLRKLKTILELFENSNVAELEICEGEDRVRLSRNAPPGAVAAAPSRPSGAEFHPDPSPSGIPAGAGSGDRTVGSGESAGAGAAEAESGTTVNSPMVGTFYRSASPDRPPFVSEGKRVEKGETLCIIEAMKLMNELPSPVSGVVRRVVPGNGEPVGFGDPLFVIE